MKKVENLKKDWETKTLGEVCQFRRGLTYSKSDEVASSNNAVLRANNINLETNTLNFDDIRYISNNIEVPQNKKLIRNSVMICIASGSRSHLGKVAFIDNDYDYAFGGFMGLLVPDSKIIDPKYFFTILTSGQFRDHINSLTAGANINNLKFSQIQDYPVAVPSLSEQKRIVKILDEKFEAIEKLKKVTGEQLMDARELFKSRLDETFSSDDSWESSFLGDVCKIGDGNHSSKYPKASEMVSEGIPFLRAGNVSDGLVLEDDMKYITPQKHEELKKGHLREGDVLFTNRGEIGKMAVVPSEFHNSNLNSQIAWFRCSSEIVNWYLYYFLSTQSSKNLIKTLETGTALKQLPIGNLKKIEIFYPSIQKQKEIVQELNGLSENVKRLEKVFKEKLSDLEVLKKSYLEQAFAGKL